MFLEIWNKGIVQLSEARLALQLFSTGTPFHVASRNLKKINTICMPCVDGASEDTAEGPVPSGFMTGLYPKVARARS